MAISSLEATSDFGSLFTLNCVSSGSLASSVIWVKDGEVLSESDTYRMTQLLQSGTTSTYFNLLEVNSGPYAITGEYSCEVSNSLGSDTRNTTIKGQYNNLVIIIIIANLLQDSVSAEVAMCS